MHDKFSVTHQIVYDYKKNPLVRVKWTVSRSGLRVRGAAPTLRRKSASPLVRIYQYNPRAARLLLQHYLRTDESVITIGRQRVVDRLQTIERLSGRCVTRKAFECSD